MGADDFGVCWVTSLHFLHAEDKMQLIIENGVDRPAYLRYQNLKKNRVETTATYQDEHTNSTGGVTVNAHYRVEANTTAHFTFDDGKTYDGCNIWADQDNTQSNAAGPTCTQLEFSIVDKKLTFDITQLEGMCHGYKAELSSSSSPSTDQAVCGFDGTATSHRYIPSDKKVASQTWRLNAGCDQTTMAKDCCHRFMARTSYAPGGFCHALHNYKSGGYKSGGCNAYCWAYDEKRCSDPNKCVFDSQCNPPDNPVHVLHDGMVDSDSTFTVSISELADDLYKYMRREMSGNYGDSTDQARCANPGTCGVTPPSITKKTIIALAVAGVAVLLLVVHLKPWRW